MPKNSCGSAVNSFPRASKNVANAAAAFLLKRISRELFIYTRYDPACQRVWVRLDGLKAESLQAENFKNLLKYAFFLRFSAILVPFKLLLNQRRALAGEIGTIWIVEP